MLQAQKFIELEEMKGVDPQAEEPKGEMLVGSGGEALRPPGMNTTISFLSLSWCIWAVAPFVVICFTLGALWPPGKPEEDEGETEEPKVCVPKQFEFNWTSIWLEEDGAPILDEVKAQGLLSQVFLVSPGFFPSYSLLVFCFSYTGLCLCFKINWSLFFSGFAMNYFPETRSRLLEA